MARARLPRGFAADLRRLRSWPSMEGSPWRQPYLAELTFGGMFRLVNKLVSGHKLRILEVGCGRGYLSLELARRGHELLGIDLNEETIRIAYQTMNTDPYKSGRGKLEYQVSDFCRLE